MGLRQVFTTSSTTTEPVHDKGSKMIHTSISKTVFAAAAFALAASAHADITLLSEGFTGGATGPGGIQTNVSAPAGQKWFPGFESAFAAQSGAADSYIAANFLTGAAAGGNFDLWLITPELTLNSQSVLSFFTRTQEAGWFDQLEVRYSAGSGTATSGFTNVLATIGAGGSYATDWQQFAIALDSSFENAGRFAFRYTGNYDTANFIGIDSVNLSTVPEPGSLALLGLGFAGFTLARRKQRRA